MWYTGNKKYAQLSFFNYKFLRFKFMNITIFELLIKMFEHDLYYK